ncbi:hypothetical protein Dimus_025368 [Dionaea muscipula]
MANTFSGITKRKRGKPAKNRVIVKKLTQTLTKSTSEVVRRENMMTFIEANKAWCIGKALGLKAVEDDIEVVAKLAVMRLLSWNARGLGRAEKRRSLRKLLMKLQRRECLGDYYVSGTQKRESQEEGHGEIGFLVRASLLGVPFPWYREPLEDDLWTWFFAFAFLGCKKPLDLLIPDLAMVCIHDFTSSCRGFGAFPRLAAHMAEFLKSST